jgi:hypothetical protein
MTTVMDGDDQALVKIQKYSDSSECDVIVLFRGREMIVQLPDYNRAVKWARMESKNYGIPADFSTEDL